MADTYLGVPVVEVTYIPAEDTLTLVDIARARADWIEETETVMGALGIMAATASDHDADIISRAMALIEMGSYD